MKQYDDDGKELKVDNKTDKNRKAAFEAISKKAILVNMTRKQISNMPFDVETSNKCSDFLKVTDPHMIQVRKLLFNPEHLSKIRSLINDSLLMVWNHTRPWDNIGFRLLPMEYYDDFNETFGKIKDEFEEAVKEFIDNYDKYLAESKKLLGNAFNANDYPDKAQLNTLFNLEIHTSKFPDIDDIRLNLSGPELVSMQKDITDKYNDTITESIETLCEMVKTPNIDRREVMKLLGVVESLNLGDDPEVTMRLTELKSTLKTAGIVYDDTSKKKKEDEESMMVMDDIEDLDEIMDDYI
jgi:hypothetical protein